MDGLPKLTTYCTLAVFLVLCSISGCWAVQCYMCSWSPLDVDNDTCSNDNFQPHRAKVLECELGCETVQMRDLNGELEMFYRNCARNPNNTMAYSKKHRGLNEETMVQCDSKLCNQGHNQLHKPTIIFTSLLVATFSCLIH